MNVPVRLGVFALALGVVFAGAYGVGGWIGPAGTDNDGHEMTATTDGHGTNGHEPAAGPGSTGQPAASGPGGLAMSADGYTLRLAGTSPTAGAPAELAFQIVDAHRAPVTRFRTSHDKQLHLVVVRRDMTGFQHLHPQMSADGTWRIQLTLDRGGDWRVFADFLPEGSDRPIILGVDLPVAGEYRPAALPAPAASTTVDGYQITVDGHLTAGRTSRLTLRVARDGAPVSDLQPYLGAYGHLVALRAGDLGYLHVHPQQTEMAGPAITFDVEVPTAGVYRLFLDFQHGGVVRTASFTGEAV
jgi:hypothetical protein